MSKSLAERPALLSSLSRWSRRLALDTMLAMWSSHDRLDIIRTPSSFAQGTRSTTSPLMVIHITIDGDRWDVKLFSSIVNQKFFSFAGVQAHVVVCCLLLNVIHGILELVSAMRVAHFVQSDVIDEPRRLRLCGGRRSYSESSLGQITFLEGRHRPSLSSQMWCLPV